MNIVKSIIAICVFAELLYAAYPYDPRYDLSDLEVSDNGYGYSQTDQALVEVFYSVQTPDEPIEFYVRQEQLSQLSNVETAQ